MTLSRASSVLRSAESARNLSQRAVVGGFDAAWELDIFGKFQRELEAATYDAEALADARDWVLVTVAADVARAYLDMRALQRELAVLRENIGVAKSSLDFEKARFQRGITNELDVALAERHLATLQAGVAPFEAQVAASQHVIAVLLGQFPEDLAKELASPGKLPALPAQIPPGLPIELLRRRPDIHAAERQLAAATARIGVATADLFPRVIVSGALGGQGGPRSSSAIPITLIGAAGPSIYWPVLDFGTLDAIVDIADLQAHEASDQLQTSDIDRCPASRRCGRLLRGRTGAPEESRSRTRGRPPSNQACHRAIRSRLDGLFECPRRRAPGIRS